MKARTCRRTASSRGSNQSPPTNGDGDVAAADVACVMAWVPSRSCRSEPTPPQPFPTNLAPRPDGAGNPSRADCGSFGGRVAGEAEPAPGILGGDGGERRAEGGLQGLPRARADRAQARLELGPGPLDGVEVGRVGREIAAGEPGG